MPLEAAVARRGFLNIRHEVGKDRVKGMVKCQTTARACGPRSP